jgi:hypothetical protein
MTKANEYIKEDDLKAYRERLSEKTAAFVKECTDLKPGADEFFQRMADTVLYSHYFSAYPEITQYIKLDGLRSYLLEYYDHFYGANTKRNEYVYTLMRLMEKYDKEADIPREIRDDLERKDRESEEAMKKYNMTGLHKRIAEMFKKSCALYLVDAIKKEGEAVKEKIDNFTDDMDKEVKKDRGLLRDVVFELRKLQHEFEKAGRNFEEMLNS